MKGLHKTDWLPSHDSSPLRIHDAITSADIQELRHHLNEEHALKAGRAGGRTLYQGIYRDDPESGCPQLLAVFCWAGAAPRLKDRDEWISWDPITRGNRLGLIVQLRRFLVLEATRHPNLASQCLGLALKNLAHRWHTHHRFEPLLVESFSDPESHHGTVYKATNWTAVGHTKGFGRHRADFYQRHDVPKKLWLYPLCAKSRQLLSQPGPLANPHLAGCLNGAAGERSPLRLKHLETLFEALQKIPEHRSRKTRRYAIGSMLGLICVGLLCGGRDLQEIWNKCAPLNQKQRAALGLMRREPKTNRLVLPSYSALGKLLAGLNSTVLARHLNDWLASHRDALPKSLALDGKAVGGLLGGLVSLTYHETGVPAAQAIHHGEKDDCEQPLARQLIESTPQNLENTVITADALHTQKQTARAIETQGADYLLAVKNNQPTLEEKCQQVLHPDSAPLFLKKSIGSVGMGERKSEASS